MKTKSGCAPYLTTFRVLLPMVLLSACVAASAQPQEPPIKMPNSEFNQGRPANFYYLADASEGYEDVCEDVLEALNEPYPGETYAKYNERHSKYLLRSRLSVPWVQMPFFGGGARNSWDIRYASIDIDNDDLHEDVFVAPMNLGGGPVHYIWIVEKGILPEGFAEISDQAWISIRDSGASAVGQGLAGRIARDISRTLRSPEIASPNVPGPGRQSFDVIELNSVRYILNTSQSIPERQKDTYLFRWSADDALDRLCRLRSRYIIED